MSPNTAELFPRFPVEPPPTIIEIEIPIQPRPQRRPRVVSRPDGRGGFRPIAIKDKQQEAAERSLEALLLPYRPVSPMEGPVYLSVECFMQPPKTAPPPARRGGLKPKEWLYRAQEGQIWHISPPDLDNLVKQIKDVMTNLGFWLDDRQICKLQAEKRYGVPARWIIRAIQGMPGWE